MRQQRLILQHVTTFYPPGRADEARRFYTLLGLKEVPRPSLVEHHDGIWFAAGDAQIHLAADNDLAIHPRRHFGLRLPVGGMQALVTVLLENGVEIEDTFDFPGWKRMYCFDPFGNKVELIEIEDGF